MREHYLLLKNTSNISKIKPFQLIENFKGGLFVINKYVFEKDFLILDFLANKSRNKVLK